MDLSDLENYINFTLISDIHNKKKRSDLDIRRLEHALSSKGISLGGFQYFTPEMSNGKVVLEAHPCHIMHGQLFKRFIQLLTDMDSPELNGVYDCLNDLIQQNPTAYRYLSNTGQYRDLSTKINVLPFICYYILKKYGEESEFWKIFRMAFYEYTQRIVKKAKGLNLSLSELLEWAFKSENIEFNGDILGRTLKENLSTIISLQWAAVDDWKFKFDLNISLDLSNSYISCVKNDWQVESEDFGDIFLDLILFEMKANKIAHKECYVIGLEDVSRVGDGLFVEDKPYSVFNQTENVTIYLNSKYNETDITDLAERKHFLYDVGDNEDFNHTIDNGDLEKLSRKLEPLDILDDIVVI